jgi:hypothetical protein
MGTTAQNGRNKISSAKKNSRKLFHWPEQARTRARGTGGRRTAPPGTNGSARVERTASMQRLELRLKRRRVTRKDQERLSRQQLTIAWKEWLQQTGAQDLGEELLFQICSDGKRTGLSLLVQLKSTANLERMGSKNDPKLIDYRLETKDLLHWEHSSPPVVVIVWDVQKNAGVWLDVAAAVTDLDVRVPRWRKQQTATIRIPRAHTTDAKGRETLRLTLAGLAMPMLTAGKELRVSHRFSFPKNKAGRAAFAEFRRFMDQGRSATVHGKLIKEFRVLGWWERVYGRRIPEYLTFSSRSEGRPLVVEVRVVGTQRTEAVTVTLQRTRLDNRQATFSTNDPGAPVSINLVMTTMANYQLAISVKMIFQHRCRTVHDSLLVTRLLIAVRQGGTLQLVLPGHAPIPQPDFAMTGGKSLNELIVWERALQMLSYIQSRVSSYGTFDVERLDGEHLPTIQRLFSILQSGELNGSMSFSAVLPRRLSQAPLEVEADGGVIDMLGVTVPLGQVHFELREPQRWVEARRASGPRRNVIELRDVPVIQKFVQWGPAGSGPGVARLVSGRPRKRLS